MSGREENGRNRRNGTKGETQNGIGTERESPGLSRANSNHPVRSRIVPRLRRRIYRDKAEGRERRVILTGSSLSFHVTVGAGRELPEVQFTRNVSPTPMRSFSVRIAGSVFGASKA